METHLPENFNLCLFQTICNDGWILFTIFENNFNVRKMLGAKKSPPQGNEKPPQDFSLKYYFGIKSFSFTC